MSSVPDSLKPTADRLNLLRNRVNDRIALIETALVESKIGVSANVGIPEKIDDVEWWISFERLGSDWQLCAGAKGHETTALQRAPAVVRLHALEVLPELVEKITAKAETFAKDIEETLRACEGWSL